MDASVDEETGQRRELQQDDGPFRELCVCSCACVQHVSEFLEWIGLGTVRMWRLCRMYLTLSLFLGRRTARGIV